MEIMTLVININARDYIQNKKVLGDLILSVSPSLLLLLLLYTVTLLTRAIGNHRWNEVYDCYIKVLRMYKPY